MLKRPGGFPLLLIFFNLRQKKKKKTGWMLGVTIHARVRERGQWLFNCCINSSLALVRCALIESLHNNGAGVTSRHIVSGNIQGVDEHDAQLLALAHS
jgi:hypothetical protein